MKTLYIAGPMTGLLDDNFAAFDTVAAFLRDRGFVVISPAESVGKRHGLPRKFYGRLDLHYLLQVDGIVLLPGWESSLGARSEVAMGLWLDLAFYILSSYGQPLDVGLEEIRPDNPCRVPQQLVGQRSNS